MQHSLVNFEYPELRDTCRIQPPADATKLLQRYVASYQDQTPKQQATLQCVKLTDLCKNPRYVKFREPLNKLYLEYDAQRARILLEEIRKETRRLVCMHNADHHRLAARASQRRSQEEFLEHWAREKLPNRDHLVTWHVYKPVPAAEPTDGHYYDTQLVTLQELCQDPYYRRLFRDKLNDLYLNWSLPKCRALLHQIDQASEQLKVQLIQQAQLKAAQKPFEDAVYAITKYFETVYFPLVSAERLRVIKSFTDEQLDAAVEVARVRFGREPEYSRCEIRVKDICTVPQQYLKEVTEYGTKHYYSEKEMLKAGTSPGVKSLLGKVAVTPPSLLRLAKQAAVCEMFALHPYRHDIAIRERYEEPGDEIKTKTYHWTDDNGTPHQYTETGYHNKIKLKSFSYEEREPYEWRDFLTPTYADDLDEDDEANAEYLLATMFTYPENLEAGEEDEDEYEDEYEDIEVE